jgi:hypothetical protein
MRVLARAYDAVLYGTAWPRALMVAMMLTICIDVVVRNLGYRLAHFFTFTEYALLLVPCLGAPWLVRERATFSSRSS